MTDKKWYLKEEVYFEPLFNHWYAWPHLIAPATCARHVVNTHKRIMTSFVNNFHLHLLANKEKDLAGSDYLNCTEEQLPDIRNLLAELKDKCVDLLDLADAIKKLDELLRNHTSGESIEPLYAQVPEPLQGYVELFLDIEHNAGYRFIEPLLYRSKFYKPELQSLSFGLISRVGERPFVFSTPRLPDENHLQTQVAFNDPLVDEIFKARETPMSDLDLQALSERVETVGGVAVTEMFTEQAPEINFQPVTEGVRLTYTGHAGFMLETADVTIMIDPVIASRDPADPDAMLSFSELPPKIDYTLLTHCHQDHVNIETLLQLRYKQDKIVVPKNNGGTLIDPAIRLMLKELNFDAVEVEDLEEIQVPGGRIVAIPFLGEHGDLNIRSKSAWYVELLGRKFFFGADSSNPDNKLYERLGSMFNDVDVLAIGMECVGAPYTWLYGALNTKTVSKNIKNSRRLNGSDYEQAFPMVEAFGADTVIVYALGREKCYKYFMGLEYDEDSRQILESNKMVEACQAKQLPSFTMNGRKTMTFSAR